MSRGLAALALVIGLGAGAGVATAATLVVRSSGPAARSYPPGKPLGAGPLVLGANDSVTVLDARGTRTFRGPGRFDPAAAAASSGTATTLAALVSQSPERRARIGAVRSVGGAAAPRSPNLWYVEADRSGAHCVIDPAKVTMWRPNMSAEQVYTITGGGRSETVTWMKGQSARDWPASLPVTAGAEYKVSAVGQTAPAALRFVILPKTAAEPIDGLAGKLIAAKCTAQLDLLVDTAAAPDQAPPAG